jgi:hypothetical protein
MPLRVAHPDSLVSRDTINRISRIKKGSSPGAPDDFPTYNPHPTRSIVSEVPDLPSVVEAGGYASWLVSPALQRERGCVARYTVPSPA